MGAGIGHSHPPPPPPPPPQQKKFIRKKKSYIYYFYWLLPTKFVGPWPLPILISSFIPSLGVSPILYTYLTIIRI
jgi:hypothetical protein